MKKILVTVFFLLFILTGCNKKVEKYDIEFFDTFDTVINVSLYETNENKAHEDLSYIKQRYVDLHRLFDNYRKYDGMENVYTINENAGIKPVVVDDLLFDLIKRSVKDYNEISKKTNILLGPVTEVWNSYRELYEAEKTKEEVINIKGHALPTDEELEKLKPLLNMDNLILNEKDKSIFLKEKGMKLDLGAVAKGYATEIISKEVEDRGVKSGVISAGGNVRIIGNPLDGRETFKIGVQNPNLNSDENIAAILSLNDTSIVTSGDYQRYFILDGKMYPHIIDPDTLKPADNLKSTTVIFKDSYLCDFLSTAAFLSTPQEIEKLAKKENAQMIWIDKDYNLDSTEKIKASMETK